MAQENDRQWHQLSAAEALSQLDASASGLDTEEVRRRLDRFGPNVLRPPKVRSAWTRLFAQFHNVLIYVLLAAGVVTLLLGHVVDASVIVAVVAINAVIGFLQEGKAERALDAVRKLLSPQAMVMRDGTRFSIAAEDLVPGDMVFIQSGDRVPADLRLYQLRELKIDESMLTGESLAVRKQTEQVPEEAALGDRLCMAYAGTLVTAGQGLGVVARTGEQTEIGRISTLLEEVETLTTPLTRQMSQFAGTLTLAILAIAAATAVFGVTVRGYSLEEMFLAAVGLAVAAIPEGLPAIITIALAIGVQRMATQRAIIRRLPAVETLGSVSTICSDKTGTLTRNEMTVQTLVTVEAVLTVSGVGYDPHGSFLLEVDNSPLDERPVIHELCLAATLCNDSALRQVDEQWQVEGDPMEGALIVLGAKAGLRPTELGERFPRIDVLPFESQHRFMATLHHDHDGNHFVFVKGAAEVLLPRCRWQLAADGESPLDQAYWLEQLERIAAKGQRTLALASRSATSDTSELRFSAIDELCLLGIVGITDPPRAEAITAVAECRAAGIRVKMITGDHVGTAAAIARQLGIGEGQPAMSGIDLDRLDDASLRRQVLEVDVFARASPEHKLRLVEAIQANGEVLAMTGDGVNDAPALKRADVGVAMGVNGTEAAKQAAEMLLADDNFASIMRAVREGRNVYDNIKKSIVFILPTNGGEALTILAAIALGRMLPVTAAQILWVNMITAVTLALALAFEPAESDIMRRPPRNPQEPLLSRFMIWRVLYVSLLMVGGTFGLFIWERMHGADIETARTVAVNALVVAEIFYLFNVRFLFAPVLNRAGLFGSRYALIAVALVSFFQILYTYLPFMQQVFSTRGLDAEAWLRIVAFGAILFLAVEAEKWVLRVMALRRGPS